MRFKFFFFFLASLIFGLNAIAQTGKISGTVKDGATGELLVGATVKVADDKGTVTDIDGNYSIELPYGDYNVKISYVGYEGTEKKIKLDKAKVTVNVEANSTTMKEVTITSDIAKTRETPIAFTNVTAQQLEEELGTRDIGLVLNDIPGGQGTAQGGGYADSKVTIRGFGDRNIAMLIDGIPLNDMETGQIYWSDWTGINAVTRILQIQRGLGASKLAIPSVGGLINIITKGIEAKQSLSFQQDFSRWGFYRSTLSYTSGRLKGGWGVSAAGSFTHFDGWSQFTPATAGFYFAKIEKQFKQRHTFSLSAYGAPQTHGQRPYTEPVALYDTAYAQSIGIKPTDYRNNNGKPLAVYSSGLNRGLNFNRNGGTLERYNIIGTDTVHAAKEQLGTKVNNFQKPQIALKYAFDINPKVFWVTTAYVSIGSGGGTTFAKSTNSTDYDSTGHYNLQKFYDNNKFNQFSIDPFYSNTLHKSSQYLYRQRNDHNWEGLLSDVNYKINDIFTLDAGIDLRDYKGSHFGEVADLLGGDYVVDAADYNNAASSKKLGDKIVYNYNTQVRWAGSMAQLEMKKGRWTAFIGITGSYNGYNRTDFFQKKDLILQDTIINQVLSANNNYTYKGVQYNSSSPQARFNATGWKWIPAYTFKIGSSFKINEFNSVFVNAGYLNKAPLIKNVIASNVSFTTNLKNELFKSIEAGYILKTNNIYAQVNAYYTVWNNIPSPSLPSITDSNGTPQYANVNGLNGRYTGIEFEGKYRIIKQLQIEAFATYSDNIYTSKDTAYFYDNNGHIYNDPSTGKPYTAYYDARGVHVGDAPQSQLSLAIRVEPVKGFYFKIRATYFMKFYSNFSPFGLNGAFAGKESWEIPNRGNFDFFTGYKWQINHRNRLDFNLVVYNFTNKKFIGAAQNNDVTYTGYANFDAKSASVFMGAPISFAIGVKYTFN